MPMATKTLLSRLKELYNYYRYGPIATWREVFVLVLADLPLLVVLPLLADAWWLWCVVFALWQFVAIMFFCLYRERKMKQNADRNE